MDNQTHNPENDWIDNRMASLAPAKEWHPDGRRALAQFKNRRDQVKAAASPRWIQLSMVAAVLVSIALVVTLLPWHVLWEGAKADRNLPTEPPKAATPEVVPEPAPVRPSPVTPGPAQPVVTPAVAVAQQPSLPSQEQKSPEQLGPGITPPKLISSAEPNYTDEARQAHIQGKIILSVTIRTDGTAKVDKVVQGLGYGLDEKAMEAVEKWRFVPGMKDGQPVDVQLPVTMNFKLY